MENPLLTVVLLFRALAISQVALLFCYLLVYERHRVGLMMALTVFAFGCYLAMPLLYFAGLPMLVPDLFASSIPALLWILAWMFFEDDEPVPWPVWLLWLGYMAIWMPDFRDRHDLGYLGDAIFLYLPQFIKLGFVLHVIRMALAGRKDDLVSQRLQLRVPIAVGAATLASIVILTEILSRDTVPLAIDAFGAIAFFACGLATNVLLFKMRSELSIVMVSAPPAPPPGVTDTLPALIEEKVATDRFYANHGATLGDLAKSLDIPEYRARAAINQGLGYRNFNQFLNTYRIREAGERLLADRAMPVLTIALDVGFKSLSSFNKSFRDLKGCTPTEYRAKTLTDSLND